MTTPEERPEPVVGADELSRALEEVVTEVPEAPTPAERLRAVKDEIAELPAVDWTRAVFKGIGDTAKQVLREGRRGAEQAYDEGWQRFDEKTRFRRRNESNTGE